MHPYALHSHHSHPPTHPTTSTSIHLHPPPIIRQATKTVFILLYFANIIKQNLHHLKVPRGVASQYDPLLNAIGDAKVVLLGAQTHGTHEFYGHRDAITRLLVEHKGYPETVDDLKLNLITLYI
jgi:hypothetical protein